ncbi:hypothetical protein BDZ89DRAFT_1060207 [Hymenopellis radicata]|nr:hypothetical protein BDZ89DRAFT_1060207 [Hymenopellis radicata]
MPLEYISDESFVRALPDPSNTDYVIFYSSVVDGQLWCPDCRVVDAFVKDTFEPSNPGTPRALLIYVGDRPTWKSKDNAYRGDPWKIHGIPTMLKVKEGKEIGRFVDDEIRDELAKLTKD